jgi:hypothetical protein
MTKSEVEKAIKVVMFDIIDECYRYSSSLPGKNRDRIFEIANEAESLMDQLILEVRDVKQLEGYSIDNPKIIEIQQKLDEKSMDYLHRLHQFD